MHKELGKKGRGELYSIVTEAGNWIEEYRTENLCLKLQLCNPRQVP